MRMRTNRKGPNEMQGHPQTKQRQMLLDIIRNSKRHVDAKELFQLAVSKDTSISPATVYRNLKLFKELDLIDEKRLGRSSCCYEAKGTYDHQHLVCNRCGRVLDFECHLSEMMQKVRAEHGFVVTKAEMFFEGHCAECSDDNKEWRDA